MNTVSKTTNEGNKTTNGDNLPTIGDTNTTKWIKVSEIPFRPAIVRCQVLQDRFHMLTLDSQGLYIFFCLDDEVDDEVDGEVDDEDTIQYKEI